MLPNFPVNIQRVHRAPSSVCRRLNPFFEQIRFFHSCVSLIDEVSRSTVQSLYDTMFRVHRNEQCCK